MNRHVEPQGRRVSSETGFTLIEMMIVVAIIGVTAALGMANFGVWKSRMDLKQAITSVQHELTVARVTSMARNIPVTTTIAMTPVGITVTTVDANTGIGLLNAVYAIPHVNGLWTVTAVGPPPVFGSVASTTVTFNSMGFRQGGAPATQNQVLLFSNDRGVRYAVRITPRGTVSWCPSESCQGTH